MKRKDCSHLLGNCRIDLTFYITKIRIYFINYSNLKEMLGIVMNFTQSISTCMKKYVTFSGRATRSEFWWFYLFTVLVNFAATSQASSFVPALLDGQDMTENESSYFLNNFFFLYLSTITSLILLLPSLAELPSEFNTPPFIIVGSSFAFANIPEINEVVVVLPCEPATTIFFIRETICPNTSPLL